MFVKICGITSEEDALLAVAMGADALGFNFTPCERQIAPGKAADIAKRLPPDVLTVGIFRNDAPDRVIKVTLGAGLNAAQLHGHETAEETREVRSKLQVVIKVFPAGDEGLKRADEYGADVIMIDSAAPGSGEVFDWALAEGAPSNRRILLAGGLTPENVVDGIERVQPWGVDVATGVESSPGVKDPSKLKDFINAAKGATPAPYEGGPDRPFDWLDDA